MNIDFQKYMRFLRGDVLETALKFTYTKGTLPSVYSRNEMILNIIKNKKILHVGCTDHKNIIEDKIKNNIWLHGLIAKKARYVVGIDIDKDAIDLVKKLGFENCFYADIEHNLVPKEVRDRYYDIVLIPDVI